MSSLLFLTKILVFRFRAYLDEIKRSLLDLIVQGGNPFPNTAIFTNVGITYWSLKINPLNIVPQTP